MQELQDYNTSGVVGKTSGKPSAARAPVRSRTLGSFMSFASAHDLRSWNSVKETDRNSPRGVIEACRKNLYSDNDFSELEIGSPTKTGSMCIPSKPFSQWRKVLKLCKLKPIRRFVNTHMTSGKGGKNGEENPHLDPDLCKMKASWKIFSIPALRKATNNFSTANLIGKGGFSEVYKGCLEDGQLVAIKRLNKGTHEENANGFLSELGILVHVDHPNTAKLIGYGVEGGFYIVLQLSSHGSLSSLLGSSRKLDWNARFKIALGVANGLLYLHEYCQRRIIHRDIKADNILLTENYEPQICDFGLSKWLPRQWTHHHVSKFEGTFGYFAPEYFMHGIVDEKTDVFSFGVLLLELITGRLALDQKQSLLLWVKPFLREHHVEKLVDPLLYGIYDEKELERMVLAADMCVQETSFLRPRMNQVVVLLKGDDHHPRNSKGNQTRSIQRTYSEELQDAKEYNSTRHLNEIKRLRKVAFESIDA